MQLAILFSGLHHMKTIFKSSSLSALQSLLSFILRGEALDFFRTSAKVEPIVNFRRVFDL